MLFFSSFFEIYNEHVRDLLANTNKPLEDRPSLRVREHPENGPYVESKSLQTILLIDLTKHPLMDSETLQELIEQGVASR